MNRQEHLEWAKFRALEYVEAGDLDQAWASMVYDLGKHEETKDHIAVDLGMALLINGGLSTQKEMREFIEGFR